MDKIAGGFGCHGELSKRRTRSVRRSNGLTPSGKTAVVHVCIDPKANSEEMPNYDRFRPPGTQKAPSKNKRRRADLREYLNFYIDGQWVDPCGPILLTWKTPRPTGSGKISLGSAADVDVAVHRRAARLQPLVTKQSRTAPGPAAGYPCRISKAGRRSRRRGHRGNGRAAVAGRWPAGSTRARSPGDGDRRAEELCVRGTTRRNADREGADRSLRADHAVELAAQSDCRQGVPGAGDRVHHDPETV